jgi:hypothetical protein
MGELKNIFLAVEDKQVLDMSQAFKVEAAKIFHKPILKVNTVSVQKERIFPLICRAYVTLNHRSSNISIHFLRLDLDFNAEKYRWR